MKHFLIMLFGVLFVTGCGVGSYSISSGSADESYLSFTCENRFEIYVTVDGKDYNVETVKTKQWKNKRNIKKTVQNTIVMSPGKHQITVKHRGVVLYSKQIFVSSREHRVIDL